MKRLALLLLIAALPAGAKTYTALKGESSISYHLVHKFHHVTGVSRNFQCQVDIGADTSKSRIAVKVPVVDFNSGNSSRDANSLEVLEAFKYPFVEFASDSVRRENDGWRVFGQLTFHGVKKPVDFRITSRSGNGKVGVKGEFDVSLTEFKVERPRLMMIPVEDALHISLDVVAPGP